MELDDQTRLQAAFGLALRRTREGQGISQERLAELAGLHRTYVGGIERGERNVSLVNIGRLARALGLSLEQLMAEVVTELGAIEPTDP